MEIGQMQHHWQDKMPTEWMVHLVVRTLLHQTLVDLIDKKYQEKSYVAKARVSWGLQIEMMPIFKAI